MNEPLPLPAGFAVGHWTDPESRTGCTVVIAPAGTRGAVEVRGGGTGTRELEALALVGYLLAGPAGEALGATEVLAAGAAGALVCGAGLVRGQSDPRRLERAAVA